MAYIHEDWKVIYLAQPKTGSRSMREWITERGAVRDVSHHGYNARMLKEKKRQGWTIFSVVRNPWDYAVSWYYHHHKLPATRPRFEVYLRTELAFCAQSYFKPHRFFWDYPRFTTHTVRYETLESDMSEVLGMEVILPRVGISKQREPDYRDYYDPKLRDFLHVWWREDVETYGYTF